MRSQRVTRFPMGCASLIKAALLAGALALGLASPALAGSPATATGTWTLAPPGTATLVRTADGNSFYNVSGERPAYSGALSGLALTNYLLIVHADGSVEGQGTETCAACTLAGRTGGYVANFSFKGTTETIAGSFTFQSGSGGLAGLHGGGGIFQGGNSGTYSYQYVFAP